MVARPQPTDIAVTDFLSKLGEVEQAVELASVTGNASEFHFLDFYHCWTHNAELSRNWKHH